MIAVFFKVFIVTIVVWFIVRYLIPHFFKMRGEDLSQSTSFEALVLQKKMEFQKIADSLSTSKIEKINSDSNSFLKLIENKFINHLEFYKKLDSKSTWQNLFFEEELSLINNSIPKISISYSDVKDIFFKLSWDRLHRGDFKKVLLLSWFYKIYMTLMLDRNLPPSFIVKDNTDNNMFWRWAFLYMVLEDKKWQSLVFNNLNIFQERRNEILSDASASKFIENPLLWWSKISTISYEISKCDEINESDLINLKQNKNDKAIIKAVMKKFHPDSFMWNLISSDFKMHYEALLNDNFSKAKACFEDV